MNLIRRCLLPAGVVAVICMTVAGFTSGGEGVLAAAVGAAIVALLFASAPLALGPAGKPGTKRAAKYFLLFMAGNSLALLAAIAILLNVGGVAAQVDKTVLGATIFASSVTWTLAMIRALATSRVPLYDLDSDD